MQEVLEREVKMDEDLFALLGLAGLTSAEQDTLLSSLSDILFQGIFAEAIPRIPEDKLSEFTALTSAHGDETEVLTFLETHVPDFNEIVASEITNIRDFIKRTSPSLSEEEKAYLK